MFIAITLHLLAVVVWVGGMFFVWMALRPVAATATVLGPRERFVLWPQTFARFFPWVWASVLLLPATGYWMVLYVFGGFGSLALYRSEGWNWPEHGHALPVFSRQPPHRTMIRDGGPVPSEWLWVWLIRKGVFVLPTIPALRGRTGISDLIRGSLMPVAY